MNVETITANLTKGQAVVVTNKSGVTVTGEYVSVNSKGINIKTADGKVRSMSTKSLSAIEPVDAVGLDPESEYTTAALAAVFDTNAKALRVVLRKLGLGVGKGHRYALTGADVAPHAETIRTELAQAS